MFVIVFYFNWVLRIALFNEAGDYNHQPIEWIGTDLNNINDEVLPTEVLSGLEFINEETKVYFYGENEGKYIPVIPGHKPLYHYSWYKI